MNDETMREAFEKWLSGTSGWKACKARFKPMGLRQTTDGSYTDFRVNDRWHAWKAAWDRTQASAPEGVESLINTCVGWVGAVACNGSLAGVAQDDIRREITNYTRSNAKAGEVEGQMLPKGWNIEVRTANGRHALCVFGPDGCFAVHGDTDHKSDIRAEVIDQLRIALSTHDKTKA